MPTAYELFEARESAVSNARSELFYPLEVSRFQWCLRDVCGGAGVGGYGFGAFRAGAWTSCSLSPQASAAAPASATPPVTAPPERFV